KALRAPPGRVNMRVVDSQDRLLSEAALFLHRRLHDLPEVEQEALQRVERKDPVLAGTKIAIIDDDIRNIFSLTSVLEQYDMEIVYAEDGRSGIDLLKNTPDIAAVLVDIMMPDIDGYETMRRIRRLKRFDSLPLIAVTAKAMMEDREKCLRAGASDYIAKPVDSDQLLSTLRVWLAEARNGE
ncbi:MAG: response regulator, partial [Geminicoccales bacterium]